MKNNFQFKELSRHRREYKMRNLNLSKIISMALYSNMPQLIFGQLLYLEKKKKNINRKSYLRLNLKKM